MVHDLVVASLTAVRAADLAVAGGKGANLGELVHAGFAVPDGFVVTTRAYTALVGTGDLSETMAGLLATGDGAAVRAAVEASPIPDAVRTAVAAAYTALGAGPVAVRSSATAEDLPGAAFAGQQDTFLDVRGEEAVLDAVRRCWASLWTDRAIAYRSRLGIDPDEISIAVVVQRLVPADVAGVLFTADPITGDRSRVVIDASRGLGEAVVSGTVTPDHYVVDGSGAVVERTCGERSGPAVPGRPPQPLLPDPVVTQLAALGRSVEQHFGRPQDVEWACADGRTWLLQARPMTALPPPPLALNRVQRKIGLQLLDYTSARPYPLDMTSWTVPGIGRLVERMLAEIIGLRLDFRAMFHESDGVVDRWVPPSPRPTPALVTAPVRLIPRILRRDTATWTRDERFTRFQDAVRELSEQDLDAADWPQLLRIPRRALDVGELIADLRVDYLPRAGADLVRLKAALTVLGLGHLTSVLIVGGRTRTEDANRALEGLADLVRADPALRTAFVELEPATFLDQLGRNGSFTAFREELHRFRAEYGHRETTTPLLMSSPTLGEDLTTVLGLLRVLLETPPRPAGSDASAQALQQVLDHRAVRLTGAQRLVRTMVAGARAGVAFREDTHFYATTLLPVLRRSLLEAGRRLVDAGVLRERDDVLHLRLEELEAIPGPAELAAADAEGLRVLARRRAAVRAELAGVPLVATASLRPPTDTAANVLVSGVAASGGQAGGQVRIVSGPEDFGTLRSGEVLVCPYTNPAWTPLFQRAAAVVVNSGGLASHAAIVAREYGIPAVMGTGNATTVLRQGQQVVVDGDTGQVTPGEP